MVLPFRLYLEIDVADQKWEPDMHLLHAPFSSILYQNLEIFNRDDLD
jgi:hypothetical protein